MAQKEAARLRTLYSFDILDSPGEREYDDIVTLAGTIAGTPGAFITFLDVSRLWFKSRMGVDTAELHREQSYCQFVVQSGEPLLIEDTLLDHRFVVCENQRIERRGEEAEGAEKAEGAVEAEEFPVLHAPPVRFYLGVPVRAGDGTVLGTLCVVDHVPRQPDPHVLPALEKLAGQVTALLELRRANAHLEAERETFMTLFEVAPVPMILVSDGVVHRANHMFSSLVTDHDTDYLEGRDPEEYLPGSSRIIQGKLDSTQIIELRNEYGGTLPVQVFHSRIRISVREYVLLALHDMTDRHEKERILQEQRQQAENASRLKDTFLSLVSHDLKSPLAGIFSMLDLLASAGDSFSTEERNEALRDLRSAAAVLMEMINQLLNMHRLQTGQIEVAVESALILPMVEDILLTLRRQLDEKKLVVHTGVDGDFALPVDTALFREALFNLISNAIKFSPVGGVLRVEGDGCEVRVIDQGAGVPPEDLENLFRKEVKTSRPGTLGESGTGLGLPLVRDIMRAHHGDVVVRSTGAEGSTFVLVVPVPRGVTP